MSNRLRGVLVIDNDATERGSIVRKLVGDGIHEQNDLVARLVEQAEAHDTSV